MWVQYYLCDCSYHKFLEIFKKDCCNKKTKNKENKIKTQCMNREMKTYKIINIWVKIILMHPSSLL